MIRLATEDLNEAYLSINLRRVMARNKLTYDDVVAASGLDERTIRAIAKGRSRPHAATVHKLATGLGVNVEALLAPVEHPPAFLFDKATNTLIEVVKHARPELFTDWDETRWRELASRVGVGGQLTEWGLVETAMRMNENWELHRQAAVVYESGDRELLAEVVRLMYRRATGH